MAPRPSLALAARLAGLLALCSLSRGDAASMAVTSDSSFASTEQTQPESMRQLEQHYVRSVLPVEIKYRFDIMKLLAPKRASSFKATKPLILLVGPYSSGKTTLIHYLVGQDVPGTRISPEPVDDGFTIVQHGPVDEEVKGRAVWNDRGHRFTGMKRNSEAFMDKARVTRCNSSFLERYELVDTPGILSNARRQQRGYDLPRAIADWAEEAALVLVVFDIKVEMSEEMAAVLKALDPHYEKVMIILNKAHTVSFPELMLSYGELKWRLAQVFGSEAEAKYVLAASFSESSAVQSEIKAKDTFGIFRKSDAELRKALVLKYSSMADTHLNSIDKRARQVIAHAHLVEEVKAGRTWLGGDKAALETKALEAAMLRVQSAWGVPADDLPSVDEFRDFMARLGNTPLSALRSGGFFVDEIAAAQRMVDEELPKIKALINSEKTRRPGG